MLCRFVKIKIPSDFQAKAGSDKFVQGSARSRCLAQSAPDQKLHLYMNFGGSTSAVEYRVSCQAPVSELPAEWSQANQVAVVCRFPETVAPMRLIAQPGWWLTFLPNHANVILGSLLRCMHTCNACIMVLQELCRVGSSQTSSCMSLQA